MADADSIRFNKNAAEFVPRGEMVKIEEQFPDLAAGITKEASK